MDVLTEDTGRSRTVKVKAKGCVSCSVGAWSGQSFNLAGAAVDFVIGDWHIKIYAQNQRTSDYKIAIRVLASNMVTGEEIGNFMSHYEIICSPSIVTVEDPRTVGKFNFTYEAELITTNLYEVFEVESHNAEELIGQGPNKWLSWGYPEYGYYEAQLTEAYPNPDYYAPVSAWVGGVTSGTEMAIGKYYERYSKDEESASMTTLNLTIACENPWGSGGETIVRGPTAPLTAYEGETFTGYNYTISHSQAGFNTQITEENNEIVYAGFLDEDYFEAEFEANGDWYPYELGDFTREGYVGDTEYEEGEHHGDPDYLVGTIRSEANKLYLKAGENYPDPNNYLYIVSLNSITIKPQGRISVKGKVLQPDGSDWDGVCKLRALWKGIEIVGNPSTSSTMKWQEEGQEIETGTDGTLDQEYGCSEITGAVGFAWDYYGGYTQSLNVNQGQLAIFHDQSDLTDKHQTPDAWRIMLQDPWKTEAFSIVHPLVATVDDFSTADLWVGTNASTTWAGGYLTVHGTATNASIHTAYPEAADCGYDSDSDDNPQPTYTQALNYQWKAWRYARVKLKSDTTCTLTVKIKYRVRRMPPEDPRLDPPSLEYDHYIKEWDIAVPAGNTYEEYVIDLVAPDRFSGTAAEVDLSDWIADVTEEPDYFRRTQQIKNITSELKHANDDTPDPPIEEDDVMEFVPHELVGVGHIERLTFSGIPNNATVMFDKLTVNLEPDLTETDSEALLTISPVWQDSEIWKLVEDEDEFWEDKYGYHPEGKRIIGGLANFKSAIDVPYANFGGYKGTGFLTISDAINWLETDSAVCGLTIGSKYQPAEEDPHHYRGNNYYLAAWLSPILWDVPEKGDVKLFDYKIKPDVPNQTTLTVEARAACDLWYVYPGIGDPMGDYGQTFPLHFVSVLGSLIQGITYKKSTRKPVEYGQVEVWQNTNEDGDLLHVGTYTSNKHHFWRSATLRTDRLYEPRTALAKLASSVLENPWWIHQLCKRQHWASVIGVIPASNGGVTYDVGLDSRHYRAYVKNGTIWLGISTNVKPLVFTDVDTGISATDVTIRMDRDKKQPRIYLSYIDGTCKTVYSTNEGSTWSTPVTIASAGTHSTFEITRDGRRLAYWVDGTAIKGKIYDARDNVVVDTFTAIASGVDDQSIDASESISSGGIWGVDLIYISSGAVTVKHSTDGQTFS